MSPMRGEGGMMEERRRAGKIHEWRKASLIKIVVAHVVPPRCLPLPLHLPSVVGPLSFALENAKET